MADYICFGLVMSATAWEIVIMQEGNAP